MFSEEGGGILLNDIDKFYYNDTFIMHNDVCVHVYLWILTYWNAWLYVFRFFFIIKFRRRFSGLKIVQCHTKTLL